VIGALGALLGMFAGVVTASASAAAWHGRYTTIDVPGATATIAVSVNDFGVVVGVYTDANGVSHGFIDRRGVFTTVNHAHAGTAPGQGTTLGFINDHGAVIGTYFNSRGKPVTFAGRPGRFTTVTDPAAAPFSTFTSAINDAGVIVGAYIDAKGMSHGFIDRHGVFTTLNDPLAGTASGQGTVAFALNNRGIIVGIYADSHGTTHGFELNNAR
jgi:uncharacterized membrane protein